jgi:hypothetical protein
MAKKEITGKKQKTAAKPAKTVKKTAKPAPEPVKTDPSTHVQLLPTTLMDGIIVELQHLMGDFQDVSDNNLTLTQRSRKIGAGIRNYGFIDKASDLAEANPRFATFFQINDLKNAMRNIETCRDIVILLRTFTRVVSNSMMVYSDEAFHMALIFYNLVREMSRRGDPEAIELFRALQPFFRRTRRVTAEPTAKELERDLHALLHGKADGKIVVENISPKVRAGARKVIDEVRKGRAAARITEEEDIKE